MDTCFDMVIACVQIALYFYSRRNSIRARLPLTMSYLNNWIASFLDGTPLRVSDKNYFYLFQKLIRLLKQDGYLCQSTIYSPLIRKIPIVMNTKLWIPRLQRAVVTPMWPNQRNRCPCENNLRSSTQNDRWIRPIWINGDISASHCTATMHKWWIYGHEHYNTN